eukprot:m.189491 g.189491  ORF g.189491 m.189491 type:complete len:914 (+) comp15429_c0_seq2:201-2942(+)
MRIAVLLGVCVLLAPLVAALTLNPAHQRATMRTQRPPAKPTPPRVFSPPPLCVQADQASAGAHIGVFDCDAGVGSQVFVFANQSRLVPRDMPGLCVTVGRDVDPDSGTPALELQPCDSRGSGAAAQTFRYNQSSEQLVHVATGNCLDLDQTDFRVELYGCNRPVSPNQQWLLPAAATPGTVVSVSTHMCWTACTVVAPGTLGPITRLVRAGNNVSIFANASRVDVVFYRDDIVRLRLFPTGTASNPTRDEMILGTDFEFPAVSVAEQPGWYALSTAHMTLRAHKSPLTFSLFDSSGMLVWAEAAPMQWNTTSTWQTLEVQAREQIFGGGMQNGRFVHTGTALVIEQGGGWDAGGRPNPAPFYMTTAGYGVLRNTFAVGLYDFASAATRATLRHDEYGLDGFFLLGPGLPAILEAYTRVSGRPFMPPVWGLQLGDSDCYNEPSKHRNTRDVVAIADNYTAYGLPAGWFLPNDGYGCGYTQLDETAAAIRARGYEMGLWTSTGLGNASWEIGTAGSRGIKTDVGWVGPGYRFALAAVKLAASLLETHGDGRRYVWTVCGWASTHAYAVVWNGDNYGTWEFIRFMIPTVLGAGLSAQAHASGDVDGIFGGSAETYVRDLQWKSFLTAAMTMSGWADFNKQPWCHGEPYTTLNRASLVRRIRLTPYLYTYARLANTTGMPPTRALVLHYPEDPATWDNTTQYEFLSGDWLLVAPVYENTTVRTGIYLPRGEWLDYANGTSYTGPAHLPPYPAPLATIPVFVRAGAIVPMWPAMPHVFAAPASPLTLDVWPGSQAGAVSNFTLYEDDGQSRAFNSEHTLQTFTLSVAADRLVVTAAAPEGAFVGQLAQRDFHVMLHIVLSPTLVTLDGTALPQAPSEQALADMAQGWFFSVAAGQARGLCTIRTGLRSTAAAWEIVVK